MGRSAAVATLLALAQTTKAALPTGARAALPESMNQMRTRGPCGAPFDDCGEASVLALSVSSERSAPTPAPSCAFGFGAALKFINFESISSFCAAFFRARLFGADSSTSSGRRSVPLLICSTPLPSTTLHVDTLTRRRLVDVFLAHPKWQPSVARAMK